EMKPGIYKFVDKALTFLHHSYRVMDCKNPDEILILPKEFDRVINPDMELSRIQTPYRLVDNNGSLLINTKDIIAIVYNTLIGDI
ncbi:hypothetical protein HZA55_06170, partial [Candidatus Poribacteria bacterium]|nr:hypothetical protein [Candidatus Poribacteria bacterium]